MHTIKNQLSFNVAILIILILFFPLILLAGDIDYGMNKILLQQNTHQYLVKEAYELLKYEYPEIIVSNMNNHIGNYETGGLWNSQLITVGAYREDEEDIVYGYGGLFNGWDPSSTHFWNADAGDDAKIFIWPNNIENAYQKARIMIYGSDVWNNSKIFIEQSGYWPQFIDPPSTYTIGWYMSYESLFDLYNTGKYYWEGYMDVNAVSHYVHNGPFYMSEGSRNYYVWEILGRVAHLLGDMGVPAHVHNDPHVSGDTYEDAMIVAYAYANGMNANSAFNNGGTIRVQDKYDPLRYLFYTTNQVADHFPSQFAGDNNYNLNYGSDTYNELQSIISGLGSPPGSVNVYQIASASFITSIRTVAGLFHWFAYNTNQVHSIQTSGTLQSNQWWRNVNVTGDVFVPASRTLYIADGANIKLNGFKVISTGGSIIIQGSMTLQGVCLKNGATFIGLYPTIQSAINSSSSGQTLELQSMTYNESVSLSSRSNITLLGQGSASRLNNISLTNSSYINIQNLSVNSNISINGGYSNNIGNIISLGSSIITSYTSASTDYYNSTAYNIGASFGYTSYGGTGDIYNNGISNADVAVYLSNNASYNVGTGNTFCDNLCDIGTSTGGYGYAISNDYTLTVPQSLCGNVFVTGQNGVCGGLAKSSGNIASDGGTSTNTDLFKEADEKYLLLLRTMTDDKRNNEYDLNRYIGTYEELISDYKNIFYNSTTLYAVKKSLLMLSHLYKESEQSDSFNKFIASLLDDKKYASFTPHLERHLVWDFVDREDFSSSITLIDKILLSVSDKDDLICELLYEKGLINKYYIKDLELANLTFNNLINDYPDHILSKFALVELGANYEKSVSKSNTISKGEGYSISNYPNPFNPTTQIKFSIPKNEFVILKVYDTIGREIAELVNEEKPAGTYTISFDASNLSSGIYFYSITAGKFNQVKKMTLLR